MQVPVFPLSLPEFPIFEPKESVYTLDKRVRIVTTGGGKWSTMNKTQSTDQQWHTSLYTIKESFFGATKNIDGLERMAHVFQYCNVRALWCFLRTTYLVQSVIRLWPSSEVPKQVPVPVLHDVLRTQTLSCKWRFWKSKCHWTKINFVTYWKIHFQQSLHWKCQSQERTDWQSILWGSFNRWFIPSFEKSLMIAAEKTFSFWRRWQWHGNGEWWGRPEQRETTVTLSSRSNVNTLSNTQPFFVFANTNPLGDKNTDKLSVQSTKALFLKSTNTFQHQSS